ncbi:MAG: replicative DNA helicase [Verrucomicrobia bacterium]|nr:replicative DNA helicase [Verrucomicrobiota bacterium]
MPSSQGTPPEKPHKTQPNGNGGRGSAQRSGARVVHNPLTGSAQDIHRAPPHSVEAEQGVLGSMLISPQDAIPAAIEKTSEPYFYIPAHQVVYRVLVEQWNAGHAIDLITFTQTLRDQNLLETIGGAAFVTSLFTFVPTAANIEYYLDIVRDKYVLRQIISTCTESVRRAYEEQSEVHALLDEVEQRVFSVGEENARTPLEPMKSHVMNALERIEKLFENKGSISGLATGFKDLDRMTSGLHPAEMTVIAARPSMGKTAFAMNIAEYVAVQQKLPVAIFSLEMSSQQLVQRMLCSRARVTLERARDGFLSEADFPKLTHAASRLAEAPIFIDDSAAITILELRAKARRLKARENIGLVVIDYLQLLRGTSKRGQDNRQIEISEISAGIKALAKELSLPVIVVAQLNRNPEMRTGSGKGRPRLSDLRESGSIEQDADVVGLLVREEYYADTEEEREDLQGKAELIIAKQRNGPVGEIKLTFLKEFTRFEDRKEEQVGMEA